MLHLTLCVCVCGIISLGARLPTPCLTSFPGLPVFYSLGVGKNGGEGRGDFIPLILVYWANIETKYVLRNV